MPLIHDLTYQSTDSTGTGNLTISTITGFESFSSAFNTGSSNTFYYSIRHLTADEWEVGVGYMSNSTVLVRDTLIDSSTGSAINFTSGTKVIACDIPASKQIDRTELIGVVIDWPMATPPDYALMCDGSAYSRTTYPDLYNVIGITYGNTSATDFLVPNRSGYFVRCWDNGAGIDPNAAGRTNRGDGTGGDVVGSKQGDTMGPHVHYVGWTQPTNTTVGGSSTRISTLGAGGQPNQTATNSGNYGSETRPSNVYTNYCIIYK